MKKIIYAVIAIFMDSAMMFAPAFAESCTCSDGSTGVKTSILADGCSCDDGKGSSVMHVLKLVVDIMSVGIGILGVIGISISGVQYLTAGGNEEQTRKAKRRIFEIVIGLGIYVLIYALLQWLLPGFNGV